MEKLRPLFPVTERFTFLNHAATAVVSLRVTEAIREAAISFGNFGGLHYPKWMERVRKVRKLVAKLLNADTEEIAFTANTSDGLALVASSIPWKPEDEVAISYPDFPANVYPWINLKRHGVKLRHIERDKNGSFNIDSVEKATSDRLRLISVSSVDYSTGFYTDLQELGNYCREKGILLCVDAIQGLGVIPMDVKKFGIHFLASGCHKWLMGGPGMGMLYVSRELVDKLVPTRIGWKSVVNEEDFAIHFDLKPGARRFETGTMNITGIYALGAALELLFEAGINSIYNRVLALNDLLYDELTRRNFVVVSCMDSKHRSGILSFSTSKDPEKLFRFLLEKNIIVSLRGGKIRVSPHFYNSEKDIEHFLKVLDDYRRIEQA